MAGRREQRAILVLLTVLGVAPLWADWMPRELSEAARAADQIVVATMVNATLTLEGQESKGEATLLVESVVFGPSQPDARPTISWSNYIYFTCPRYDFELQMGRRAIWLLQKDGAGKLRADAGNIIYLDEPNKASVIGAIRRLTDHGTFSDPSSAQSRLLATLQDQQSRPSSTP